MKHTPANCPHRGDGKTFGCTECMPKQKPKELDIHTEVVKIFWAELSCYPTEREVKTMKKIEKLIKKLLTQQRTELLDEIPEKLEGSNDYEKGWNACVDQFKSLLNKKDESIR